MAAKHELKIQQSNAPKRWPCSLRVRGPHFASKVSYNAGAATDDYSGPTHIFDVRALLPIFYLEHPKVMRRRCSPYTFQRTRDEARQNVGRGTTERRRAFAIKYRDKIGLPSFLNIRKGLTSEYGSQSFRLLGVDGWGD